MTLEKSFQETKTEGSLMRDDLSHRLRRIVCLTLKSINLPVRLCSLSFRKYPCNALYPESMMAKEKQPAEASCQLIEHINYSTNGNKVIRNFVQP